MNAVRHFLDRHVQAGGGGRPAFQDGEGSLSYAELAEQSARFASGLRAAGIGRERRVALLLLDTVAFPVCFWGCLRAGAVPVPVNTLLTPEQTAHVLADCRAEAVVVSRALLPPLGAVLDASGARVVVAEQLAEFLGPPGDTVEAAADEVAFWLYSSGSTGSPKGVRHVHGSLLATAETYGAQVLGVRADDVVFSAAKLFFAYGLGNSMTFPMHAGAQAVLLPSRPTPEAVTGIMRRFRPTVFCAVPTLYAAMLAQPDLPRGAGSDRLRVCASAGEALPEPIGLRWEERVGAPILDGIGSTEMLHIFLSNRVGDIRYGTSGRAVPGYELRVVNEAGRDCADAEVGELLVHGPSAAEGYWNQRAKSRRTFEGEWTRTGDKYVRNPDGTYAYQGRADDMFKTSGIWVSPFEVEAALIAHPAVQEAAVIGREDSDGLLKPMAFVVLRAGHDAADDALQEGLKAHVKERAGPWKYPRWVRVVEHLPKTATGKIQRYKLRQEAGL